MKTLFKSWIIRAVALLFAASAAFAQDRVPFRQEELDQMLAPVALYPDSLLSQMLMASTYPLEVVQAARWSRANPGLRGQDAANAAEHMDWDPSVKSLTAFPQVLSMMDEKLEWTERLGEAFLVQQEDVMGTVQGLRRRAEAAGNLRSNDQMRVVRQGEAIVIEPPAPQIVYVPYYNTTVVYGAWWWPAYPPLYWGPPPGYYARPAYAPGFYWGSGIVISAGFFFGHFDWPHRHVNVVHVHHHAHAHPTRAHSAWRHDSVHRRGAPFRHAEVRQRFEPSRAIDSRRDAGRNDAARAERRAGDSLAADTRQPRPAVQERREERREPAGNRVTPGNDGNRADRTAVNRNDERVRSFAQPETRNTQTDRGIQPGRSTPPANDRRGERKDMPRSQARGTGPQPAAAVPAVPAVHTQPPVVPATASTPAAPRQALDGGRRAEARAMPPQQNNVPRATAPAPRAASSPAPGPAAAPAAAPRVESHQQRGIPGARPQGSGDQRGERSANRDSNRKS